MSTSLPSSNAEPERYRGRPLLLFLEFYVLDAISELDAERQEFARHAVQKVFGGGVDWRATMRSTLRLEDRIDGELRTLWNRNQEIASSNNCELAPVQFAKMIVEQNFAHLIEVQS